jgi:hypothetical protein
MASPTARREEALAKMGDVGSIRSGGDTPIEADVCIAFAPAFAFDDDLIR